MVAGSVIAMELGDVLGWNVGDALLGGALPTFQPSNRVLAPLPIVPPFFQVVGTTAMGLASGKWDEALRSMPILIPGGTSFARFAGLLPPGVPGSEMGQRAAQLFQRTYADYNQPAPDGRIAVFSGQGTLRGFYRPWELVRYGLGVKGGELDKETQLLQTLVSNRDQIREERQAYMDARFRNNAAEAEKISRGFADRFGFDLPVSEKDIKAMQLRRRITRLEQVIRTLPPGQARNDLIQVVAATLGAEGQGILGVEPGVLGAGSRVREAARTANLGRLRFNANTQLGPLDTVNPQRIGRQQGVNRQQPPF
jgi:hypothetical protein